METQQNTTLPSGYEGLTFEKVWAMFRETDKKFQETNKKFQENEKLLRQNQKMMSALGRKFGKVIEHMFIPNLKEKFNLLGFEFEKSSPDVLIGSKEHNIYMEIDVFLENSDNALAVEVKTQANIDDIREHVERMEKLRRYFDLHDDRRKLYGAVAAAVIPENVHDFALKQGFYVIKQSGDNISVEEPQNKARAW
jgi:predicted AAA+ superfamily ATPase